MTPTDEPRENHARAALEIKNGVSDNASGQVIQAGQVRTVNVHAPAPAETSLGSRFAEERYRASLVLIDSLKPWLHNLRRWSNPWPLLSAEELAIERRELSNFDWDSANSAIWEAWKPLELLASEDVRHAFKSLVAQMFGNTAATLGEPVAQDGLDGMVAEMDRRHDALLEALRADLRR
ncbi:hypothetical protein [Streptomyces plumbiresistens]|uniref:Uncharacterized protein n=1 Tax=Streptomyces plumbiresistens TaxID=511811 RepID=A0ABP7STL5_9ACTN